MAFQQGSVLWTELMTPDIKAASDFYGRTAGWTFQQIDMGSGLYHVAFIGEEMIAGLADMQEGMEAETSYWLSYIGVTDVDQTARDAEAADARILQGPFSVPGVGRMVILQDPQGAQIAFMTPSN